MTSVFYVRHQAAGVMHEFPFRSPPTEEQQAAIARLCFQRCGGTHPKTNEPYWVRIVEIPLLSAADVPEVPERSLSVATTAGVGEFVVAARGEVTPAGA
jgi:hypothetical protein